MGLDCSHDAWHGAYSAFTRWRNAMADAAGYELAEVKYKSMGYSLEQPLYDTGHLPPMCHEGDWTDPATGQEVIPDDHLLYLLAHSDCDGYLEPDACERLADRLTALLPKITGNLGGHVGDVRETTMQFIDGLRAAAGSGERLEFG